MITNSDGDTGRFKFLCDAEHDDPEQAPTYRPGDAVLLAPETAKALGLTGIWRMTPEEVEAALEVECGA